MQQGWSFCVQCGHKIAFSALACPKCGAPTQRAAANENISEKSYGTAVALCGIFGVVGIHHFYVGNVVHGLIDLGLFLATVIFYIAGMEPGNEGLLAVAVLCFIADAIHTMIVFFRLIVGKQHDGSGKLIAIPK